MAELKSEIDAHNIVFVGDFNPKIFQPAWFAAQGLLRQEESDAAKIEIIHPEIVRFALDWLNIEVVHERFKASTLQFPYFEILRDLIVGTFKTLRHTPIRQMGINREMHMRMASAENWNAFGDRLAPKEIWENVLKSPGMLGLTMQGARADEYNGYINVRIEPSKRIEFGVYFQINDHYDFSKMEGSLGCDAVVETLQTSWAASMDRSASIVETLLEKE